MVLLIRISRMDNPYFPLRMELTKRMEKRGKMMKEIKIN